MRDFWSPKFILDLNSIKIREALLSLMPSGKKSRCAAARMVGKRAVKYRFILSSLAPAYPPYKSGMKKSHQNP